MTRAATTVEAAATAADRASTVKAIAASAMEAVAAVEFITSADSTTEPFVAMESGHDPNHRAHNTHVHSNRRRNTDDRRTHGTRGRRR